MRAATSIPNSPSMNAANLGGNTDMKNLNADAQGDLARLPQD